MNRQETEQIASELTERFKSNHPDLTAHVESVEGTNDILISFFWNRISLEKWDDTQSFRCKCGNYQSVLESEIIPFFK